MTGGQEKNFGTLGPKLRENRARQYYGDKSLQIRVETTNYMAYKDKCDVGQTKGNILYLTAFVSQPHRELKLIATADNIFNIFCVGQCGGSNGTLSTYPHCKTCVLHRA